MKTFAIIDFYNMVFKTRHAHIRNDIDMQIGLSMHTFFNSFNALNKIGNIDHFVVCCDDSSWRYKEYPEYKLNRKLDNLSKSPTEQEEDKLFFEAIKELWDYLDTKTNLTTLKYKGAEADDMVAMWCMAHQEDRNIIISSDADYEQLLSSNVEMYDTTTGLRTTVDGYFDKNGKPHVKKNGAEKPDPEYSLFMKCVRGDSDNIKSAYPRVREKSTKNKVGIREAYEDRHTKGFAYNNFFNQTWKDHLDNTHVVKDRFEFNRKLMDLTMQPEEIKVGCLNHIMEQTSKEPVRDIGFHFMRFCNGHDLQDILRTPEKYATMLNKRYPYEIQS